MKTISLFGLNFAAEPLSSIADEIVGRAERREKDLVFTANVDHLVLRMEDIRFHRAYDQATIVTPDGMPIVWMSRILKRPLPERVAGSDLMLEVARRLPAKSLSVFLLGGEPGVAEKAAERLQTLAPGLSVAGILSPPLFFEEEEQTNGRIIEAVNRANPDLLLVGLGAPRQEIWLWENRSRLSFGVGMGVGGTFDFLAGRVRRSPRWIRNAGFEWAFRLAMEPRRLWKRYLLRDVKFLVLAMRELRKHGGKNGSRE